MHKYIALVSLFILTFTVNAKTPTLADLSWLSGDWQTAPGAKRHIDEHWTVAAGGTMMGMSRTVLNEKTIQFEYLRIEQRADGIYYVAHPQGQCPGTDFKLTLASADKAVFENLQHDFPKRIIYHKGADGSLTAAVDRGEGTKAIFFEYRRMK